MGGVVLGAVPSALEFVGDLLTFAVVVVCCCLVAGAAVWRAGVRVARRYPLDATSLTLTQYVLSAFDRSPDLICAGMAVCLDSVLWRGCGGALATWIVVLCTFALLIALFFVWIPGHSRQAAKIVDGGVAALKAEADPWKRIWWDCWPRITLGIGLCVAAKIAALVARSLPRG